MGYSILRVTQALYLVTASIRSAPSPSLRLWPSDHVVFVCRSSPYQLELVTRPIFHRRRKDSSIVGSVEVPESSLTSHS